MALFRPQITLFEAAQPTTNVLPGAVSIKKQINNEQF